MWPTIHNGGTLFLIKHSNCEYVNRIFCLFRTPIQLFWQILEQHMLILRNPHTNQTHLSPDFHFKLETMSQDLIRTSMVWLSATGNRSFNLSWMSHEIRVVVSYSLSQSKSLKQSQWWCALVIIRITLNSVSVCVCKLRTAWCLHSKCWSLTQPIRVHDKASTRMRSPVFLPSNEMSTRKCLEQRAN